MNKTISKKNLIILGVILVAFPFVADKMFNWNYGVLLANFAILYIIAVSGLDILFGYSGQISMGHAAFYCIGAYGSVLIHQFTGLPVIVTILMGTVIAGLPGFQAGVPLLVPGDHRLRRGGLPAGGSVSGKYYRQLYRQVHGHDLSVWI